MAVVYCKVRVLAAGSPDGRFGQLHEYMYLLDSLSSKADGRRWVKHAVVFCPCIEHVIAAYGLHTNPLRTDPKWVHSFWGMECGPAK